MKNMVLTVILFLPHATYAIKEQIAVKKITEKKQKIDLLTFYFHAEWLTLPYDILSVILQRTSIHKNTLVQTQEWDSKIKTTSITWHKTEKF